MSMQVSRCVRVCTWLCEGVCACRCVCKKCVGVCASVWAGQGPNKVWVAEPGKDEVRSEFGWVGCMYVLSPVSLLLLI